MNKLIFFVCLILSVDTTCIFGQAMMGPYWLYDNHHLTDKYILNPAFAGIKYDPKVFVSTQRMEIQLREAPTIHLLGGHGRLDFGRKNRYSERNSRNGVGGLVFADINGPYQAVGIKFDYAYILPLNRDNTNLSLGLGGMLFSKRVNLNKYNSMPIDDPIIAANMGNKTIVPDFNAGVLFTRRQFYAGFSVSQLMENSFHFSSLNYTPASIYRNFYLMTGYRFVYDWFELEPSIVGGYNFAPESYSNNGKFVDINMECFLKPVVFTLSYRLDGFLTTAVLYRIPELELGIRFDLFSTNASDARFNSIGLMASYTFLKNAR